MTDKIEQLDIVGKLKMIADSKVGDPMPACLGGDQFDWATPLSKLCQEAADEIERLREYEWKYKDLCDE